MLTVHTIFNSAAISSWLDLTSANSKYNRMYVTFTENNFVYSVYVTDAHN